jgi:hypothetical protein
MPAQNRTTEFDRIYQDLAGGFRTITHNDDAWFDEDSPEARERFAAELDQDAQQLAAIAGRLRRLVD